MTDFKSSFIYPEKYELLNLKFHSNKLYDLFNKKILFRIEVSPNNPFGITPPNGLLIYGPPSNGKIVLAKQFAQATQLPYIILNRYNFLESGNNHIDRQFSELISTSQSVSPCVIILDNVETVIPDRKKLANNDEYVDVMSILSLIKGCGKKGVYIFATTSKPTDVDAQLGMSGYLNELFYAPFPDMEQRLVIIKCLLCTKPCQQDVDYEFIAKESELFTIGDLVSLVEEIAINSALDNTIINNEIIQLTLNHFRHPLTSIEKKKYDDIDLLLNARNKRAPNRIIGFK